MAWGLLSILFSILIFFNFYHTSKIPLYALIYFVLESLLIIILGIGLSKYINWTRIVSMIIVPFKLAQWHILILYILLEILLYTPFPFLRAYTDKYFYSYLSLFGLVWCVFHYIMYIRFFNHPQIKILFQNANK